MPRLILEFCDTLAYKEYTHCDDYNGWTHSHSAGRSLYRFYKRRMAKLARRNAQVTIGEYFAPEVQVGPSWDPLDGGKAIEFDTFRTEGGTFILWTEYERAIVFEMIYSWGWGCHICGRSH